MYFTIHHGKERMVICHMTLRRINFFIVSYFLCSNKAGYVLIKFNNIFVLMHTPHNVYDNTH